MATDNTPPLRARPSKYANRPAPPPRGKQRQIFRFLGLPILVGAGVLLYNGLHDHMVLPQCDSARAKQSLTDVLKQLQLEPLRYEPIKTVSSSKDEVVCNAVLPLPNGGSVVADYRFYWQGSSANMKYSISRQAAKSS